MRREYLKVMDCSTCHITKRDRDFLELGYPEYSQPEPKSVIYDALEYGYLIYVEKEPEQAERLNEMIEEGFSQAFANLLENARWEGCQYILLDADGPVYDDLPKFDW